MLKKGSKLYSILTGTCPRCHEEHMYVNKNPYVITELMKMHDHCGNCGLKYKIEPNFFFGAMYVSYALAVALSIVIFAIAQLGFDADIPTSFISIIIGLIIFMPLLTRFSRNIYINMFIKYRPEMGKNPKI
ncbi:MAG: DUF983 domain-containing protein [Flavobacterium sp.]|nr:DUF983 domain-containing protein [Flavobacterium sp.]